ncbi:MAG: M23 family metallopeptidase [Prevotellaceae bacterium]|jgi:hypothetical protein|nr:M23 family metallopeptidase [Prevotellaceae bacterium]
MRSTHFLILLITCFICGTQGSWAQTNRRDVELATEYTNKGVDIWGNANAVGSYTVFIRFSALNNTQHMSSYSAILAGRSKIISFKPIDEQKSVSCRYSYYYVRGYKNRKVDSTFIYRLPFSILKTDSVRVLSLFNVNERYFNQSSDHNWIAWQFSLNQNDTVFAMRKGLVVKIVDSYDPVDKEGVVVSYQTERNSVTVEHADGTLCYYRVMEKGAFMVSEGDVVYPGTPLGKAGTFNKGGNYQVRISISYPEIDKELAKKPVENKSVFKNVYYNPYFVTQGGTQQLLHGKYYKSVSSAELIRQEMTKKEIKKLTK